MIPPHSKALVLMKDEGLRTYVLQPVERTTKKTELLVAKGVVEVAPNRLFGIMVANMKNSSILVHKHMKLAELTERSHQW